LGIASKLFLNGKLVPGIQLIKNLAHFDAQIEGCDWIITGEGKLDSQTFSGKTIQGVMTSAKAKNIKIAAFCGAIDLDKKGIEDFGLDYADAILNHSEDLNDAMKNGYNYVKEMAEAFAKTL
jgi:glycerate kinase